MQLLIGEVATVYGAAAVVHAMLNGWPLPAAMGLTLAAIATGAGLTRALLWGMGRIRLIAPAASGDSQTGTP
jgi:hypothetical protein